MANMAIPGFEKIVEDRIKKAQRDGAFKNLQGVGEPLPVDDVSHIPEELRLAYKVLKNADFLPPEVELRKEIYQTEALLAAMDEGVDKYRTLKKLNLLIQKINLMRSGSIELDIPQQYETKVVDRIEAGTDRRSKK